MASIPIQNETDYTLTDDMTQQIIRDAQEHFGEEVHAIRVQAGLARHALNVRTREVRYAFSPRTLALVIPCPWSKSTPPLWRLSSPWMRSQRQRSSPYPSRTLEEEEDMEPLETSLESLDEGQDDEEEEDDFFKLDDPVEDADEDDEDNIFDNEDDED